MTQRHLGNQTKFSDTVGSFHRKNRVVNFSFSICVHFNSLNYFPVFHICTSFLSIHKN